MSPSRNVLMLGAGFVAKPALEMLHEEGFVVTVACVDLDAARSLCRGFNNTRAIFLDVTSADDLDAEIAKVDLVISLIPYTFHVSVIQSAIRKKKHVVTTSYISPAIRELDEAAKEAGIIVLNECGLDPGIDHLLAIKTIDEVHHAGGSIKGLRSYCGALPAPESATNPLGYKFSWSPRGALLALRNPATFHVGGKAQEVAGLNLMDHARPFYDPEILDLVAYPNRDSTPYRKCYDIPEASTVIRNTLRYTKFPGIIKALADIGFLEDGNVPYLDITRAPLPWKDVTRSITNALSPSERDLIIAIASKTTFKSAQTRSHVIGGLRWLGLFSDQVVIPRGNPLDTLCATLEEKLKYQAGERDMVILQHQFEIEHRNGDLETRVLSVTEYGDPNGHSALSKLVGIPCGIAVKKVLDETISGTGVLAPVEWKVAEPLLEELEAHGIRAHVNRSFLQRKTEKYPSLRVSAIQVA